jgi:hypothetical protein
MQESPMKLIALAAMLALGGTAVAQTAPAAQDVQTVDDPKGGYQPAGPALSGPVTPGTTVVVMPSKSPSEAYPAPAPLASYPWCNAGQFDNCKQRNDPK